MTTPQKETEPALSAAPPDALPAKRGPGRPPGHPKTGGRKKGVPNRTTVETREYIAKRADPVEFLCRVALGLQIVAAPAPGSREKALLRPTLEQRLTAAQVLARKIIPDLKSQEITGKDGDPLLTPAPPASIEALQRMIEVARR